MSAEWIPLTSHETLPPGKVDLKVMSFNILGQLLVSRSVYPYTAKNTLLWKHRKFVLLNQIRQVDPDILCLQECDNFDNFWVPELKALGYEGHRAIKGDAARNHGSATFFKTSKFEFISFQNVHYSDLASQHENPITKYELAKQNVGLVCGLRLKRDQNQNQNQDEERIVVFNTHLFWDWRGPFVRLEQMRLAFQSISLFTQSLVSDHPLNDSPSANYHLIMCGDYNTNPDAPLYKILTTPSAPDLVASQSLSIDDFLPPPTVFLPPVKPKDGCKGSPNQLGNLEVLCEKVGKTMEEIQSEEFYQTFRQQRLSEILSSIEYYRSFPPLNSAYSQYRSLDPESEVACEPYEGLSNWKGEPVYTSFEGAYKGTFDYIFTPKPSTSRLPSPSTISSRESQDQSGSASSSSSSSSMTPSTENNVFDLFTQSAHRLVPLSLLRIPPVSQLTVQVALPNETHGSDHLPVACHFALLPPS